MKKLQLFILIVFSSFSSISINPDAVNSITELAVTSSERVETESDSVSKRKKLTICDCAELSLKGLKSSGLDDQKIKAFEEEFRKELQECEELGDKINKKTESMSEAQRVEMRERFMADCPAMEELETLAMEVMMQAYEEIESDNFDDSESDSQAENELIVVEQIEIDYDSAEKICHCRDLKMRMSDRLESVRREVLEKRYESKDCEVLLGKFYDHMSMLSEDQQKIKREELNGFCELSMKFEASTDSFDEDNVELSSNNIVTAKNKSMDVQSEVTICSCTELSLRGFKEVSIDGPERYDDVKMKIFEEKHAFELQKCEALGDEINKEFELISEEERESRRQIYMDNCPAMKELEALIMKQMEDAMNETEELQPEVIEED